MTDVFLSHNSADKPAVEVLAHRLRAAGVEPWLDKWNLIPGNPWQVDIEQALDNCKTCAVFIGPSGMGPWQNEEMRAAINRRVSKGDFRVIPVLLPGTARPKRSELPTFLTATTWVEFHKTLDDEDAFHRLLAGIRGIAPGASVDDVMESGQCPYRGLQVFDVEHAPLFFGRRALTEWLLEAIRPAEGKSNRFLAMLGASGSGKSSLARAGLLAPLRQGELPDSQHWAQIILKPGAKPLESLAIALCSNPVTGKGQHPADLIQHFHDHDSQLHWLCRQALHGQPESYRVVVLVDQFEEIFTLCHDEAERQAFINNLLTGAWDVTGQTLVLLTLRADFYGKCAAYPQLAAALSDDQFLISPMNEAELREAIESPALRTGCELEAGLADVLLKDVKNQPGSLPLLEYTLTRLWEKRQSRVLRLSDYQALGGLEGALNQRADEIYAGLSDEQKTICQKIFLRLVQPGEGTEDTRRRANLSEFNEDDATEQVIRKLTDVRLITTQKTAENAQAFAEVTHEALIRNWSLLRSWIEADRESLKQQHQISLAATEWEQSGCDNAWLLAGTRLQLAEEWQQKNNSKLSLGENDFLAQSRNVHEQRLKTEKKKRERQTQLLREKAELKEKQKLMVEQQVQEQKRSLWRTRWLSGILALLTACMLVALWFAVQSTHKAEQAQKDMEKALITAQEQQLQTNFNLAKVFEEKAQFSLSNGERNQNVSDFKKAWLYVLEALSLPLRKEMAISPTFLNRLSMFGEQKLPTELKQTSCLKIGKINLIAYSPDGKLIATDSEDGSVRLWNAKTGGIIKTLRGHKRGVRALVYSSDGKFLASGSMDETVRIWDVNTGILLKTLDVHGGWVNALVYSPYNNVIASGSMDGIVRLWNAGTGELVKVLQGHKRGVRALVYSPDGKVIVSGSADNTIRLWDISTGTLVRTLQGHRDQIIALAYSPKGERLVSSSMDKTLQLWSVSTGESIKTLSGHSGWVNTLAYSPDGGTIASGAVDKTIRLWDANTGLFLKALEGHDGEVTTLAYDPSGKVIASGSMDQTVRLWDLTTGKSLKTIQGHADEVTALAYSPNSNVIASASMDQTVRLWNADTGSTLQVLQGHEDCVNAVVYNPDGSTIVTGSKDDTIRLWDANTGKLIKILKNNGDAPLKNNEIGNISEYLGVGVDTLSTDVNFRKGINALAYSFDGKILASGSNDAMVKLWDMNTGLLLKDLRGHKGVVGSLAYEPNGKLLASGSMDGTVRIWDVDTGRNIRTLAVNRGGVTTLAYSPDGKILASGTTGSMVHLWDVSTGKLIKSLKGHNDDVLSLAYSRDGKILAVGSRSMVGLWDTVSGTLLKILQGHESWVKALIYSPNDKILVSGSSDQTVRLWDTSVIFPLKPLQGHDSLISSLVYSPDGKMLASGSMDAKIRIWDTDKSEPLKILQGHKGWVQALAYNADGKVLASVSNNDNVIWLWDAYKGNLLKKLRGHGDEIKSLVYSSEDKILASGSRDSTIRLWDINTSETIKILEGHKDGVTALAYSPDEKVLASASKDKTIRLWDINTGETIRILEGHTDGVTVLAYSPDGKIIASASKDKMIRLWDINTGESIKILKGHENGIGSLVFNPNGKILVSASSTDKTIRLWDVDTGKILQVVQSLASVLTYSPGDKVLVIAGKDINYLYNDNSNVTYHLLYDFDYKEVSATLRFLWKMELDELTFKQQDYPQSLFPQMGYHIAFSKETEKYHSLLDMPHPNETKLQQVVRFLEARCAYQHPERYGCTPARE